MATSGWVSIVGSTDTGAGVEAKLDTAFGNIDTEITKIVLQEARIADLESTGISVLSGSSLAPQTIPVTATKVVSFDTLDIEAGVGTTGSVAGQSVTANITGIYKLRYEAFVSYASNVDITWQIYKNAAPFGASITLSGEGAGIFPLVLISSANLVATDVLELHATASAQTDITIAQANGSLEKTHF